eukprot:CAMPEP_0173443516 /NCGR_PEP_ID=MMETSP1357-20121228/30011_1 /TAXON_ID=77926 /ORGANISM="Hemiselmis rufescens, Strain PCC563" /LENGTH=113 /DNA_ID=CAMNT_0014409431 /DNA_START=24 /DNA_END=362 /DNA_ORIENTATION=-
MAEKSVRVRHNGKVSTLDIIVIDDTPDGGLEVFRQLAEQLDLRDVSRLKVVHKGRMVPSSDICRVLRESPTSVIQVFGASDTLAPVPLTVRASNALRGMRESYDAASAAAGRS